MQKIGIADSIRCLLEGARMLTRKELRNFVIVPIIINVIIFSALSYYMFSNLGTWIDYTITHYVPDWGWIRDAFGWILTVIVGLFVVLLTAFTSSLIAGLIAAPFNGLLAERVELLETGSAPPEETIRAMIPRTVQRELRKLRYFIPRMLVIVILCFFFSFIPVVHIIVPIIGFLWGAWSSAIQYLDYPFDNHRIDFLTMKNQLSDQKGITIGFGGIVGLISSIPLLNFIIMPAAVVGATLLWVRAFKEA